MLGYQSVEDNADQQFSHCAIDNGNPTIYKPTWLVLDDINVDLISYFALATTVVSVVLFNIPAVLALLVAAALLVPLRLFLPRPKPPQGLVLITGASSGVGAELSYIFARKKKGSRSDPSRPERGSNLRRLRIMSPTSMLQRLMQVKSMLA